MRWSTGGSCSQVDACRGASASATPVAALRGGGGGALACAANSRCRLNRLNPPSPPTPHSVLVLQSLSSLYSCLFRSLLLLRLREYKPRMT